MKILIWIVLLAVVGFGVGYAIYGRVGNDYLSINAIFLEPKSLLDTVAVAALGTKKIRQAILASAAIGAGIGLVIGIVHMFAATKGRKS